LWQARKDFRNKNVLTLTKQISSFDRKLKFLPAAKRDVVEESFFFDVIDIHNAFINSRKLFISTLELYLDRHMPEGHKILNRKEEEWQSQHDMLLK